MDCVNVSMEAIHIVQSFFGEKRKQTHKRARARERETVERHQHKKRTESNVLSHQYEMPINIYLCQGNAISSCFDMFVFAFSSIASGSVVVICFEM